MANYRDSTSNVNISSSHANDYISLQEYTTVANMYIPPQSLSRLNVVTGYESFFNSDPSFAQRTDNVRINPPSQTPVMIGYDPHSAHQQVPVVPTEIPIPSGNPVLAQRMNIQAKYPLPIPNRQKMSSAPVRRDYEYPGLSNYRRNMF